VTHFSPSCAALGLALTFATASATVRANQPTYTSFERDVIHRELARTGGKLDPAPEGKIISRIDVVRLEVFDERDPIPDFVNVFHTTTREEAIRQELLFREGEPFTASRVDESARNFRSLRQLSLVLVVPVDDGEPGRVRVLVITKDVWSVRLNWDLEFVGERLNFLVLHPSEENLAGTHVSVGALFTLYPYTYSAGLTLGHNRLFGSRFAASGSYNLFFNRETGKNEGSYGSFIYSLPRYSAEQEWSFNTGLLWSDQLGRINLRTTRSVGAGNPAFDREFGSAIAETRRFTYRAEKYVGGSEVTRSFGREHKIDLTAGLEVDRLAYTPHIPADTEPALRDRALDVIPLGDTRYSPFVQLESYENRFLKTIELETLGLQEDIRLGHEALLRVYPASTRLGSSRDLIGVLSGVSYTLALGDGLARAVVSSTIEYAAERKHQVLTTVALRLATPRLGLGRLIFDSFTAERSYNYLNRAYILGGDDRLRGYPTGSTEIAGAEEQRGEDAFALNSEFRSRGVDILSAQCGFALFHDLGDAGPSLGELELKQSVGLGLRVLFPQFDRVVFRVDWAVPLSPGYDRLPGAFTVAFEQAFGLASLVAPTLESRFE
jgi:hypothetical protein